MHFLDTLHVLGLNKFESIDACLFLGIYPLLISESIQIKLFEVAKVNVWRFEELGPFFSPPQFLFMLLSVIAIQV